jgi:histone H3/H4
VRPASATSHAGGPALSNQYDHEEVLIVVSKMKKYIRDRSGMNTSDAVANAIGEHVRSVCDEAIRAAARDGRKTVLDRDVPRSRR